MFKNSTFLSKIKIIFLSITLSFLTLHAQGFIKAQNVPGDVFGITDTSKAWISTNFTKMQIYPINETNGTTQSTKKDIFIKALYGQGNIAFLVKWKDMNLTQSSEINSTKESFSVQFSTSQEGISYLKMGYIDAPVLVYNLEVVKTLDSNKTNLSEEYSDSNDSNYSNKEDGFEELNSSSISSNFEELNSSNASNTNEIDEPNYSNELNDSSISDDFKELNTSSINETNDSNIDELNNLEEFDDLNITALKLDINQTKEKKEEKRREFIALGENSIKSIIPSKQDYTITLKQEDGYSIATFTRSLSGEHKNLKSGLFAISFSINKSENNQTIADKKLSPWIAVQLSEKKGSEALLERLTKEVEGDSVKGRDIAYKNCSICHRYQDVKKAQKNMAPNLSYAGGLYDSLYLRNSLLHPSQVIAKDDSNGTSFLWQAQGDNGEIISTMPTFEWLSPQEIDDLISFLQTLK